MAELNYRGKVALVSGASSGMGRSTAVAFAKAGAVARNLAEVGYLLPPLTIQG